MNRILQLLALAEEELLTADLLLENQRLRACLSRTYYAMYYTTQALLAHKNLSTKTHRGTIQKFSQYFVKTGEFPTDFAQSLGNAYDLRQLSDYEESISVTIDQANRVLDGAKSFLKTAQEYLSRA